MVILLQTGAKDLMLDSWMGMPSGLYPIVWWGWIPEGMDSSSSSPYSLFTPRMAFVGRDVC